MKLAHSLTEFVTILLLLLCLSGCGASATLQVEKEIPSVPIRPISFTLVAAPGVPLSEQELNALRARFIDSLAWEGGLRVGPNDSFKVIGTVTQYDLAPLHRPLLMAWVPSHFDSTWVVRDEHDQTIGSARIMGGTSFNSRFETDDTVLEKVGERLSDFLTKQYDASRPTK